jgi:hypothetical protein
VRNRHVLYLRVYNFPQRYLISINRARSSSEDLFAISDSASSKLKLANAIEIVVPGKLPHTTISVTENLVTIL